MKEICEALKLEEQAQSRVDAINVCYSLGKKFIEHFNKIYIDVSNQAVNHWCNEMQAWYDQMNDIVLKYNKKHLNNSQKKDWFYSFGSSYEEYFNNNENEIEMYEELIDDLERTDNVLESIKTIFNIE